MVTTKTVQNELQKLQSLEPDLVTWHIVLEYALDILEPLDEQPLPYNEKRLHQLLLNGAMDWVHYSYSGCSLIYHVDIAKRLHVNPDDYPADRLLLRQAHMLTLAENLIRKTADHQRGEVA